LQPYGQLAEKSKFNLAWNDKTAGNLKEALKGFQALTETVSDPELKIFLRFQTADILKKQAKYEEAINYLEKIVQQEPSLDLAQLSNYLIGQIYLYDLEDTATAKKEFQKAQDIDRSSDLSQYIDKNADAGIVEKYLMIGFNLLKQAYSMSLPDKYAEALKNFDRALEVNPKDGLSYAGKSLIFLWLGEREKALESSKRAVRLSPDNEVTLVNLAYVYIELGMIDEAIAELKRLVSAKPRSWQGYYNLGYAYVVKNNYSEAANAFEAAARVKPDSAGILNNQGWCLWKLGKYAEASHIFERALAVDPQFKDALFNLGLIYKASGRYEEAKTKLDELFRITPQYPDLEYYLSDVNRLMRLRSSPARE
jgi:tetratricopeptide (TPR) repeat protein